MTQFYVSFTKKLAGPCPSIDDARKKAIGLLKTGKYPNTSLSITKDTPHGSYGYIWDVRNDPDYPCDWAYCTANGRRYWAINPKNGKILYPI